jgi:ribonuclease E
MRADSSPPGAGAEPGEEGAEASGIGRRLFRRSRKAATRPAGPPEHGGDPASPAPAAGRGPAAAQSAAQPPVVPFTGRQVPQSAPPFQAPAAAPSGGQPPLVIFQPPDITSAARRAPSAPAAPAETSEQAPARDAAQPHEDSDGPEASGAGTARKRRRGGRSHSRARGAGDEAAGQGADAAPGEGDSGQASPDAAEDAGDGDAAESGDGGPAKRRRRRRRSGTSAEGDASAADDPPNTVVHVRPPRSAGDESSDVKGVKGSTRLEAKRQRRREGRESGRRRPPVITESEFLARREAVERLMVVRQRDDRTQIAVMEDGVLVEHYVDRASHQSYVGNVYLGRVQNVLPSMEAAFVDIGKGRNAVLYAGEVNFDASGLEGESKRIESALKSGQPIVVQATKDPIGHKGARLTSQVSLPGRYLVYVPGASMTGISRKLPDTERTRLKQILRQVMPEDAGVIVRTAAEGATEEELASDVARLTAQWEAIERKAKSATAPELLYGEPDLTIRVVRDIFNEDFAKLVIASEGEWDVVGEYVRYVAPGLAERLERWNGDGDVFSSYRIDEQIAKALERKVWLPSGGSLVIDPTEAMTVIDVNTGKFTGQGGNLEQTVTRNNLEAAEEIVRQLRLRDIGGIIVIDFIDMVLESNRDLVLRRLLECLARDRTKHQVAEVTSLGLVQMTRKRVGSGLLEAFSEPCEHCNGRGAIITTDSAEHAAHADRHSREPGSRTNAARAIATVAASSVPAAHGTTEAGQPGEPSVPAGADGGQAATDGQPGGSNGQGGRRRRRAGRSSGPPDSTTQDSATPGTAAPDAGAPDGVPQASAAQESAPQDGAPHRSTARDGAVQDAAPGESSEAAAQDGVAAEAAARGDEAGEAPAPEGSAPDGPATDAAGPDGPAPEGAGRYAAALGEAGQEHDGPSQNGTHHDGPAPEVPQEAQQPAS